MVKSPVFYAAIRGDDSGEATVVIVTTAAQETREEERNGLQSVLQLMLYRQEKNTKHDLKYDRRQPAPNEHAQKRQFLDVHPSPMPLFNSR